MSDVPVVDELQQVAVLDSILHPGQLMLVIEIFAPLGEPHGGEALLVERGVIPAPQETIAAELEDGLEGGGDLIGARLVGEPETPIRLAHVQNRARQLPRGRIALIAE